VRLVVHEKCDPELIRDGFRGGLFVLLFAQTKSKDKFTAGSKMRVVL
jgi:hypothetical protein